MKSERICVFYLYLFIYFFFLFCFHVFSIGSSASDHLSFESQLLEVAIRTNDVSKVKHFLMIHRDKFQVC
jgi:hypothetical protein